MTAIQPGREAADPVTPTLPKRARPASRHMVVFVGRWVIPVVFLLCAVGAVVFEGVVRDLDILLTQVAARAAFASETVTAVSALDPVLGFTSGDGWYVVRIPFLAGSALFLAVVAGSAAIINALTPTRAGVRVWVGVVGVVAGLVVIILANQVRLLVELVVLQATTQPGLHTLDNVWGTTALTITTTAVIAALLLFLVIRPRARRRA